MPKITRKAPAAKVIEPPIQYAGKPEYAYIDGLSAKLVEVAASLTPCPKCKVPSDETIWCCGSACANCHLSQLNGSWFKSSHIADKWANSPYASAAFMEKYNQYKTAETLAKSKVLPKVLVCTACGAHNLSGEAFSPCCDTCPACPHTVDCQKPDSSYIYSACECGQCPEWEEEEEEEEGEENCTCPDCMPEEDEENGEESDSPSIVQTPEGYYLCPICDTAYKWKASAIVCLNGHAQSKHPPVPSRSRRSNPPHPAWLSDQTVPSIPIDTAIFQSVDPISAMATFYLLSYMEVVDIPPSARQGYFSEDVAAYEVMAGRASALKRELVGQLAPIFATYVDMTVGGEFRHHQAVRETSGVLCGVTRPTAWSLWSGLRAKYGPSILLDIADMFEDGSMGSGFGGSKWAAAARLVYQYETGKFLTVDKRFPAWLFVDRIFTMQHNGGSLLNKVTWQGQGYLSDQSQPPPHVGSWDTVKTVGDAHAQNPPNLSLLAFLASPAARSLVNPWWTARNKARRACGLPVEVCPVVPPKLAYDPEEGAQAVFPPAKRFAKRVTGFRMPIRVAQVTFYGENGEVTQMERDEGLYKDYSRYSRLRAHTTYYYPAWQRDVYLTREGKWRGLPALRTLNHAEERRRKREELERYRQMMTTSTGGEF